MISIPTAAEIERFIRKAHATLAAAHRAPKKGPGRPAKAAKAAKAKKSDGRRRAPVDVARVLETLGRAKDGLSAPGIATAIGEKSRVRVLDALHKLRDAKQVKLVGLRRKAKWLKA